MPLTEADLRNEPSASQRTIAKVEELVRLGPLRKTRRRSSYLDHFIHLLDVRSIPGGVEAYCRVWDSSNVQIGFGDGSVDVEKFVIINPPVLVKDPAGSVKRDIHHPDTGIKIGEDIYRMDPRVALLDAIAHSMKVIPRFGPVAIRPGSVGRSTLTAYPDADPESVTVDGKLSRSATVSWADTRSGAGTAADDSSASAAMSQGEKSGSNWIIARCPFIFNTASIPDTATIDTATLSLYSLGSGDTTEGSNPADLAIVAGYSASNTALATGDYEVSQWGSTEFATRITLATFVGSAAYHDFSLNASGKSHISKTGVTNYGLRPGNDIDNAAPTARSFGSGYFADQAGTTNDPKLVVTYTSKVNALIFGGGI